MNESSVIAYFRSEAKYLHPMAITTMGLQIAAEPFYRLEPEDEFGHVILEALNTSYGRVPHPTTWNLLDPLLAKANVKTWNTFAKKARCITFDLSGNELQIKESFWDGKGFEANEDPKIILKTPVTPEAIDDSINSLLGKMEL